MAEKMDGAKAASLAFRIITLAMSVSAAVMMATASQLIINSGRGTVVDVSYTNYNALVYVLSKIRSSSTLHIPSRGSTEFAW
jgi:hypothetical protein